MPGVLNIKTLSLFEIIPDFYYERVRSIFELMKNEFSLWGERRRDIIGRNGSFGCYGGLGMCFFFLQLSNRFFAYSYE